MLPISKKRLKPVMFRFKAVSRKILYSTLLLFSFVILARSVASTLGAIHNDYYASGYNILNGTYLSGSVPSSITGVDSDYLIVRSVATDTSVTYNPSGYATKGSTSMVAGSVPNLTSNDSEYMIFKSASSGPDTKDYVDNNTSDVDSRADKGAHSNFAAQQSGPDLINDTLTEEDTGTTSTLWLYVNADDETRTGWTRVGTNPYLGAIDYSTNYVWVSGNNLFVGDFSFTDSGKSTETINSVTVQLNATQNQIGCKLEVFVWDGSVWASLGTQSTPTSWGWMNYTATTELDTWTKIDGAKIYILSTSASGTYEVDCARLKVDYISYNYELDLEVQWTNVDFDEPNEQLCIYGGSMGAENITVDVWNGSGWENLFTDLNSGWNNVSVSLYLDSSTFTIRFKGSIETGDTLQDAWNIDAVLLHTWTNQHTAEVEFTGSSNTYNWKQLNWTINSAWNIGSVNVTIQLYNYVLGSYPTRGNGYIAYTSSTTANTDETRSQLIMSNPQDFRNNTGNWKIRIKGVKNTDIKFNLKADLIEFKPTHPSQLVSTEFSFSSLTSSTPTQLNFTIVSQSNISSVTNIVQIWNYSSSAYASSGEGYLTYTSSESNETRSLSINTSPQLYTSNSSAKIKITSVLATQSPFQQEVNQVKLLYSHSAGVMPLDWSIALLYVSPLFFVPLLLLFLKLKRKKSTKAHIGKRPDAFSKSFGITPQLMIGKTILLEVDPKSDYQNALLNFASEARNSGKALLVITGMNSTLHTAISETDNTKFLLTSLKTSRIQQVNEKEAVLPAADLSVLLNAIERIQKAQEGKTTCLLLDNLSDIILTCGFEKSYRFTRLLLETISSSTTTALFVFNPEAHDPTISSSIRGLFQIHLAYTKQGPEVKTFFGL